MFVRWVPRSNRRGDYNFCYLSQTQRVEGKPKNQTLAALGSIALKPSKPEREVFWMQVKISLDKLNLATAERAKIEAAIAQKVPKGKNPHGDSDACVEWYTPPEFIELARDVMGGIDLDPASNDLAQTWIKAGKYFTIEDDGLIQPWFGRVWCNPPYGKEQPKGRKAPDWLEKALSCYESGEIEVAILLLNRVGSTWYREKKKRASAICEVEKRIAFLDATGRKQKSPRYHNDFLYLGKDIELFEKKYKKLGEVRKF